MRRFDDFIEAADAALERVAVIAAVLALVSFARFLAVVLSR